MPEHPKFSTWGRYDARDYARLARQRFKDQPGAYHRVRYLPSTRWPDFPWAVLCFDWLSDADACNESGEVINDAVRPQ